MKRAIIVLVIIAAVGAGAGAYYLRRGGGELQVNTAPITRGEIIDTVGSTGTVQAVTTVQVGAELADVGPGSVIYVAKDVEHRFRDFTEDLEMLVLFAPAYTGRRAAPPA